MRFDNIEIPEYKEDLFKKLTELATTYINLKLDFDKNEAELNKLKDNIKKVLTSKITSENKIKRIGVYVEDGKTR